MKKKIEKDKISLTKIQESFLNDYKNSKLSEEPLRKKINIIYEKKKKINSLSKSLKLANIVTNHKEVTMNNRRRNQLDRLEKEYVPFTGPLSFLSKYLKNFKSNNGKMIININKKSWKYERRKVEKIYSEYSFTGTEKLKYIYDFNQWIGIVYMWYFCMSQSKNFSIPILDTIEPSDTVKFHKYYLLNFFSDIEKDGSNSFYDLRDCEDFIDGKISKEEFNDDPPRSKGKHDMEEKWNEQMLETCLVLGKEIENKF